jgi:hypothetical protein
VLEHRQVTFTKLNQVSVPTTVIVSDIKFYGFGACPQDQYYLSTNFTYSDCRSTRNFLFLFI